jgi:hypothetical protein
MGTVLKFKLVRKRSDREGTAARAPCEVVIFPGVRIERHEFDLSHRLRDSAGQDDFGDLGGGSRPRKTS